MTTSTIWTDSLNNFLLLSDYWPGPFWLISFFVTVAIIRFLDVLSYPEKPKVTYLKKALRCDGSSVGEVIEKCPILEEIYSPPIFWGRSGHIQTAAYGFFGHASLKRTYNSRHVAKLSDGSSVIFDVFEPVKSHPSGGDYTLAMCPGIANTSESNYIRTCVHYAQENGFRCAVLNHLGALKHVPLTSNRIFSYGGTEEMETMLIFLMEHYPTTRFFCIGFSMGANITTRLIAKLLPERLKRVVLGLSVAQGYCAARSAAKYQEWENGRRAYNYIITENVKRLLRRNYEMAVLPHVKNGLVEEQRLWAATSIVALDELYSRRVWGYHNLQDFYRDISSISLINHIQIPMVFINAADDPLIPSCLWEPVCDICAENANFAFVLTKHGGHLGFLEGRGVAPNSVTWLDRFIVELTNAAITVYDGWVLEDRSAIEMMD